MSKKESELIKITDDVTWMGVLDYDIRTFDIVMHTEHGTTYNSYFINAEKKAVVEVAKEKFRDTYFSKLRSLTRPEEIEYIILDHTEPDHSGSLRMLLDMAPSATVVGSGNAVRYLEDIVNLPFKSLVVRDGDTLDLGNKTLRFIAAPNLHWPDSIYTYLEEDKVLFTCDSFGAHYCTPDIFSEFTDEYMGAFKYYFDVILKPFSRFMLKAIDKIQALDISYICTGHGPVHHAAAGKAIELSRTWAEEYVKLTAERERNNILITYVSAYGYTGEAAELIAEGIRETEGLKTEVVDIENIDAGELEKKIIEADGILVGSPTINQNTLLPVYRLFSLINPLRDKGKLGGAYGSYGWSGEAPGIILGNLRMLKLKTFDESGTFKFSPGSYKADLLVDFGRKYASKFLEECGEIKSPGN
jgi:flavorubredoxin